MRKTIFISKRGGKVLNLSAIHEQLDCLLALSTNGEYELSVSKRKSKRSLDQNALMWKWFSVIEEATGTGSQDIHGIVSVGNHDEVVVGGTRTLNTAEMAEFLTKVQADVASEFGIALPTAEDLYNNFI